ncbi:chaplin [Streptomyces sp. NPDC059037]|uniref:chaplin n=1 Tax=Streptomyces sp. NPDC059037 TaxID=3346710 RepID=UPI00369E66ED
MRLRTILATVALTTAAVIGGAGAAAADPFPGAYAVGAAKYSPGILSGNVVQVPVHVPVNACGNTVNVIGALNPAIGNRCFIR